MNEDYYRGQIRSGIERLRKLYFPRDEVLTLLKVTPQTGETQVAEMAAGGWGGQRIVATSGTGSSESGAWQFQIAAADDWVTSQDYMQQVIALRVGGRRWKVKKIEAPGGLAMVWKIKAEIQ